MKLVKVEWEDAYAPGPPWVLPDELPETPSANRVAQVGYLVKEGKAGIWLASGFTKDGAINNPFFIPRGMVKKVEEVKRK